MTTPINCNNTYIQVSIPGSVLNAKNYSNICFRVGGERCCYPASVYSYSNTVCKPLATGISVQVCCPPPEPPGPPPPCLESLDLTGYTAIVSYDPDICEAGHRCDRAKFILYINNTEIGLVNLNNANDGLPRSTTLTIPTGVVPNDNQYNIILLKDSSISIAHKGIARIQIKNLDNKIILDSCLPNDQALLVNVCEPSP